MQRFDSNLAAIRTLKLMEAEDRPPTPDEQAVLARYSGFGDSAFNDAFRPYGPDNPWKRRGDELRRLVNEDEYQAIERSRLNAFYTTPEVIEAAWNGLQRLGAESLDHPRVLEPSAGSGRFLGLQPVEMASRSWRTAVELDSLTGRITRQLYPNADVYVMGFQDAPIPDDSIDIAVSNIPFGNYPVSDPAFRKGRAHLTRQIHNYFFAKTLDKLRPGGVLAFVTSHHTLDAPSARPVREALAERADLLAAVRLPSNAFPDTEVVTDVVFMRKRGPHDPAGDSSWVETASVDLEAGREGSSYTRPVQLNRYFLDHPDMVLGRQTARGTMYHAGEYTVEGTEGQDLDAALNNAVERMPTGLLNDAPPASEEPRGAPTLNPRAHHEGSYVIDHQGALRVVRNSGLEASGLSKNDEGRVRQMLQVRDAARAVLNAQLEEAPSKEVQEAQGRLHGAYDAFVMAYGPLNARRNADLMRQDPEGAFLRALEQWDKETPQRIKEASSLSSADKDALKMPLFNERVVRGLGQRTPATARDAVAVSYNETGRLDLERIGELLGRSADSVRAELAGQGAIYKNPVGDWEAADEYLTGDVRGKLKTAVAATSANPAYQANVEALKAVLPPDLPPSQIDVQLGTPWVPDGDVNAFVAHLLDAQGYGYGYRRNADFFRYVPATATWVPEARMFANRAKLTSEWGTERMPATEIIERLLNGKAIEVNDKDSDGKPVRNAKETVAAQEKAAAVQAEFKKWIWDDQDRAERLAAQYNETFNNLRPRVFDGSHLALPGMTTKWADQLHQHQKDAIWRVVQDGSALLAHEVGFGKTAVMVAAGMELRRLGLSRKNIYVVPKATHAQFREQFQDIYPYAKVLFPDDADFTPSRRPEFMSRVATGDWDAVIVSDSQFRRIPVRPETEAAFLREELDDLRSAMQAELEDHGRSRTHKEMQKALTRLETRLKETLDRVGDAADRTVYFEDLGVDQMFVDEADMFKNLRFNTRMGRIKGLPNSDSQRAWDMYQKVRYLQRRGGGRGVVFATGTPVANTIAELWTMMRYLQQPMLEERGLQHFDAWAKTFGGVTEGLEQTPTGAYRLTQRFAKFMNVPEISHLWQATADIRVASEVPALMKRQPRLVNDQGKQERTVIAARPDDALKDYMKTLARRADELHGKDPRDDNMLKIANDARMASLDMRMVDPDAPVNPQGKVGLAVDKVAEIHRETAGDRGAQLVFLDLGTPKAVDKVADDAPPDAGESLETAEERDVLRNVYANLRRQLLAKGIPESEIAFVHDAKNNKQKEALFKKVNDGQVRVLIGSTGKMGAGVNVQERAAALHHLDAPWRPRDIEQREGRILRQGNTVYGPVVDDESGEVLDEGKGVRIYTYVTEGSFDAYMWQAIEAKAKAIKALMRRNATARSIEDVDSLVLSAAEAKALASGNPDVMRAVQLKNDVSRLEMVRASHRDGQFRARQQLQSVPLRIGHLQGMAAKMERDAALASGREKEPFAMTVQGTGHAERPAAGEALRRAVLATPAGAAPENAPQVGWFNGFALRATPIEDGFKLLLRNPDTGLDYATNPIPAADMTAAGLVQRVENAVAAIPKRLEATRRDLANAESSLKTYQEQATKPFPEQERLDRLKTELAALEHKLQGQPEEAVPA